MADHYEYTRIVQKGDEMKVAPAKSMPVPVFHTHLMQAKTMRSKLAICFKKLAETGAFSDSPKELFDHRMEILGFLPEELKDG